MFGKTITRIAIVAALGLAALGATAASALADSGSSWFAMDNQMRYGMVWASTPLCNLATHSASFDTWVVQPPQYTKGIYLSVAVYARDVSTGGGWQFSGARTNFINTQTSNNGAEPYITIPMDYTHTTYAGIAGHTYQFQVDYTWAPPGGVWQTWQYFNVAPNTWLFQNGSPISGYLYCRL